MDRMRILSLMVLALVLYTGLAGRLYYLQIIKAPDIKENSEKQREAVIPLHPYRGKIVDRNNRVLAINKNIYTVSVDRIKMPDDLRANWRDSVRRVGEFFQMNESEIQKHIAGLEDKISRPLKRNVSEEEKSAIKALHIPGVHFDPYQERVYPEKTLASTIVGFTGTDNVGQSGIEYAMNEELKGQRVDLRFDKDIRRMIADHDYTKDVSNYGNDIVLTIDGYIQHVVERELKNTYQEMDARYVNAVVLDTQTSDILAIAEYPNFDPNEPDQYTPNYRQPRILTQVYEPGSVMKPFIVIAGLENKVVTPQTQIYCENGSWRIHGRNLRDDIHRFENLSVHDILVYSSNIGTVKIAQRLGESKDDYKRQAAIIYDVYKRFGFKDVNDKDRFSTPIAGETAGLLNPPDTWWPAAISNIPYGQGMATNTLILAGAYNAIANRGVYRKPQLIHGQRTGEGVFIPSPYQEAVRVTDTVIANDVTRMMIDVTEDPEGTGRKVKIPGFYIAGKTGTAQKVGEGDTTYTRGLRIATFAGFFPAEDPEVTIVVMVDEPKNKKYGGEVAGPAWKKIAEEIIAYKGIAPTRKFDLTATTLKNEITVTKQYHPLGSMKRLPGLLEQERVFGQGYMPNVVGLTKRDAFLLLAKEGLYIQFKGSGKVISQEIAPGEALLERGHSGILICETALTDPSVRSVSDLLAQR